MAMGAAPLLPHRPMRADAPLRRPVPALRRRADGDRLRAAGQRRLRLHPPARRTPPRRPGARSAPRARAAPSIPGADDPPLRADAGALASRSRGACASTACPRFPIPRPRSHPVAEIALRSDHDGAIFAIPAASTPSRGRSGAPPEVWADRPPTRTKLYAEDPTARRRTQQLLIQSGIALAGDVAALARPRMDHGRARPGTARGLLPRAAPVRRQCLP